MVSTHRFPLHSLRAKRWDAGKRTCALVCLGVGKSRLCCKGTSLLCTLQSRRCMCHLGTTPSVRLTMPPRHDKASVWVLAFFATRRLVRVHRCSDRLHRLCYSLHVVMLCVLPLLLDIDFFPSPRLVSDIDCGARVLACHACHVLQDTSCQLQLPA